MKKIKKLPERKLKYIYGIWIIFLLAFIAVHSLFQLQRLEPVLIILTAIPVIAAAWYFGFWGGLLSALLAYPVDLLLLLLLVQDVNFMFTVPGISAAVLILFIGTVVGRMSDNQAQALREKEDHEYAEKSLDEFETYLRYVIDSSPSITYSMTTDYKVIWIAQNVESILGYTVAESQEPGWWKDHLHPDDRKDVLAGMQRVFKDDRLVHEYRFRFKDNTYHWMHDKLQLIRDEEGNPAEIIGAWLDITERKMMEESLREKANAMQALAQIDNKMNAVTEIEELLSLVCSNAARLLHVPKTIIIISGSDLKMEVKDSFGLADKRATRDEFERSWKKLDLIGPSFTKRDLLVFDEIPPDFPHMAEFHKRENVHAFVAAPLLVKGQVKGALVIFNTTPRHWSAEEKQLLEMLAGQAAIAFDKAQLFTREQSRRIELSALYDLSRVLVETDNTHAIFEKIVHGAVKILNTTFARLALIEDSKLVIRAAHPIRVLEGDLQVGQKEPLEAHPFCQQALAENKPVVLKAGDSRISAVESGFFLFDLAKSVCLVPLGTGMNSLGLLLLGEARSVEREPFDEDKIHLARSIGDQASVAIQRALLSEQTEKYIQQLEALHQIDLAISSSTDLHMILNTLVEEAASQLRAETVDILLYDPITLTLEFSAGTGFRTGVAHSHLRLGEGNAGSVALEQRVIVVRDLVNTDNLARRELIEEEGFVSYIGAPLVAKGETKGVLEVFYRDLIKVDQHWLDYFKMLAQQAAIAIESAQSFEGLQRSTLDLALAYDDTLEGWARALELRDEETEGHSERVTETALRLAKEMGMSAEELVHMRRGALLHDIGKMGIPDAILTKPGKLTDEEWKIMRQHPQYSYDMLKSIAHLRPALDIPYCHHEKWDGTGYPRGLKGEEIPLAARIFAVVDVWDALTSDRPYRDAWPEDKAREYIQEQTGKHFDPEVVERFLPVMSEKV